MINPESRTLEWIDSLRARYPYIKDASLLEKTIRAFSLLESLVRSGYTNSEILLDVLYEDIKYNQVLATACHIAAHPLYCNVCFLRISARATRSFSI